jgi:hypothetical protein
VKASGAGPLGTYGNRETPPTGVRSERRSRRHALKAAQRLLTSSVSSRFCWHAAAGQVHVDVGRALVAHVSQVKRCGSPWACPVCAPVVRERRAHEIDAGLGRHLAAGGGVEFVTLTLRHHLADALEPRLAVVSEALHHVLSGSPWKRRQKRLGYVGSIRTTEVTWGEVNGWHPHSHALLLFERPLTDAEREDLRSWLFERWAGVVARKGFGTVTERHGVDVRPVRSAGEVSSYLAKVDGGWGAGLELARSDLKTSHPLLLLRRLVATGESRWAALWQEYERATFGRRAIVWSPGLRARLGLDQEVSDEEAAAGDGMDVALLRAVIEAAIWNAGAAAGTHGQVLDVIEQRAALLLWLSDFFGHEPPPLEATEGGDHGTQQEPPEEDRPEPPGEDPPALHRAADRTLTFAERIERARGRIAAQRQEGPHQGPPTPTHETPAIGAEGPAAGGSGVAPAVPQGFTLTLGGGGSRVGAADHV